jgi:hypothetical protein
MKAFEEMPLLEYFLIIDKKIADMKKQTAADGKRSSKRTD